MCFYHFKIVIELFLMCQQYYLIQSIFTYIWRPILKQAKQKSLLLLPGLENVEIMEESSGPYSDMVGWGGGVFVYFYVMIEWFIGYQCNFKKDRSLRLTEEIKPEQKSSTT